MGKFGKAATVGLGAVVVGGIAAGKALYDIGAQFDNAYDSIRTTTGATGRELEGLKTDFREIVKSVPTDFDTASQAIAKLNQRLDISGKPLQTLSKQVLELSRITGTDLDTNIEAVTRTFGDWGVSVKQQPAFLDKMFRASQATGIAVGDLGQQMVRYGAPLRQMGFGFDEAAAMVGKFEKEGVNAQLVMGSLRIALGKMATEGVEDPSKALGILTQRIKDAGSAGEANKLAIETFGARAGPDMAAAIREGRFEYDDLVATIKGGKETIIGAGQDTMDFGERWQMLKNRIFVALEPVATKVFNAIGDGMLMLSNLMAGKGNISEQFRTAIADIRSAITPLIPMFGFIVNTAKLRLQGLVEVFKGLFTWIRGFITFWSGVFQGDFSKMWEGIKLVFSGALTTIKGLLMFATAPIRAAAALIGSVIADPIKSAVDALVGIVKGAFGLAKDAINLYLTPYKIAAGKVADAVMAAFGVIKELAGKVGSWLSNAAGTIGNWVSTFASKALELGKAIAGGVKDGVDAIADRILAALKAPINLFIRAWNDLEFSIPGKKIGPVSFPGFSIGTPDIGELAMGTTFWRGGPAVIGERGPELVWDLPRGAAVADAHRTAALMSGTHRRLALDEEGRSGGDISFGDINVVGDGNPDVGHLFAQLNARLRARGA